MAAVDLVGDDGVVPRVLRQPTVVGARLDGDVADHDALEVDAVVFLILQDLLRQLRNVVTGVALAGDVEIVSLELREALEPVHQERVRVVDCRRISKLSGSTVASFAD
jgi:hypothetical protein